MTKKQRRLWFIAYHEAGHAMANHILGLRNTKVTIIPDKETLGRAEGGKRSIELRAFIENYRPFLYEHERGKIARWHAEVVSLLAGMEAVRLFMPGVKFRWGTESDERNASEILWFLYPEDEARLVYRWLALRAKHLVELEWARPGIQALAKALIEKRELSGKEARNVICEASRQRTDALLAERRNKNSGRGATS